MSFRKCSYKQRNPMNLSNKHSPVHISNYNVHDKQRICTNTRTAWSRGSSAHRDTPITLGARKSCTLLPHDGATPRGLITVISRKEATKPQQQRLACARRVFPARAGGLRFPAAWLARRLLHICVQLALLRLATLGMPPLGRARAEVLPGRM